MRDEEYVLNICDDVLGLRSSRQHRFNFLCGDTGRPLPIDAYYRDLNLVIEYHERQHSEAVPIFDRRMTASGVPRGQQRQIYDDRKRTELPNHGIALVEFSYSEFLHNSKGRLCRHPAQDREVVRRRLDNYI